MKYFKYSVKARRVIIVLMIINSFAFVVNFLNITPKITSKNDSGYEYWYYIFTDGNVYFSDITGSCDGENEKYKNFWPFLNYTNDRDCIKQEFFYRTKFRGVFPDYDISEFIIYSIFIFGIPLLRKMW